MMEEAFNTDLPERGIKDAVSNMYPDIHRISTLKEKYHRSVVCRALIEVYADKFENMLIGIIGKSEPGRIFASGGLSLSEDWLQFLEKRCSLKFSRIKSCHPALEGVYKTIKQNEVNYGN